MRSLIKAIAIFLQTSIWFDLEVDIVAQGLEVYIFLKYIRSTVAYFIGILCPGC